MICISCIVHKFLTVFTVKLCIFTKSVQGKHDLRKSFPPFSKYFGRNLTLGSSHFLGLCRGNFVVVLKYLGIAGFTY